MPLALSRFLVILFARSVAASSNPSDYVREMVWIPEKTVAVLRTRLVVSSAFLSSRKKRMHLTMMKKWLVTRDNKRSFLYLFDASAAGPSVGACNIRAPIVTIAKTRDGQCGHLVPNPYFGDLELWAREMRVLRKKSRAKPWESRDRRIFWRGVIRAAKSCEQDKGNIARLQAVALTVEHPEEFDVGCIKCAPMKTNSCSVRDEFEQKFVENPTVVEPSPQSAWTNYKYLLNLPGSTTGSYSRNLNHLWIVGGIVLLWDVGGTEFYSDRLVEGKTHLTVNKSTVRQAVSRVEENPTLARTLLRGAESVYREFISAERLSHTLSTFFENYIRTYFQDRDLQSYLAEIIHDRQHDNNSTAAKCGDLVEVHVKHHRPYLATVKDDDIRAYQETTNGTLFVPLAATDDNCFDLLAAQFD